MRVLHRRRADDAATLPVDLDKLGSAAEIAAGHLPAPAVEKAQTLVRRAAERQNLAAGRTVVALLGATGSGKSTLFNALVGRDVAPMAARRPTTTRPLAAVWASGDDGDTADATELLDWLGVPERTTGGPGGPGGPGGADGRGGPGSGRADGELAGLVLLDLPDIDSTAREHRQVATRMAGSVDVLVWVLDPQKYADAIVHRDYLTRMSAHAEVTLVVLNQVDTLAADERDGVLLDLDRLLARDGLHDVPVLPVSARTGEGLDLLRERIKTVTASTRATRLRLAADVRTTAADLLRTAELEGDGEEPPTTVGERPARRLSATAAEAAGVDAVREAVRGAYVRAARRRVGWPPVRWLARLRPDPIRRLHLDKVGSSEAALARTSLPGPTPVQEAAVRSAAHSLVASATTHLPGTWRDDVLLDVEGRIPSLVDSLDQRIAGTELEQTRRPAWWSLFGVLQGLFFAAALAGGAWLGTLAMLAYLQMPEPATPMAGPVPWPTSLLVGGLIIGLVLALVGGLLARAGARRRARRVDRRLRAEVDETVRAQVVAPLERQLDEFATFRRIVTALAG
ncbi:50S ribosome-binding GTPase [Georgenia halophila]|uniref:50S ribosome-binding GTPase n=1 Tax=Georgenia halophila TaxID=620889 RepID=A0ABP8L7D6_9MICO